MTNALRGTHILLSNSLVPIHHLKKNEKSDNREEYYLVAGNTRKNLCFRVSIILKTIIILYKFYCVKCLYSGLFIPTYLLVHLIHANINIFLNLQN